MTEDFDFDFDLDPGRSPSRTKDREPGEPRETPSDADGDAGRPRANGGRANGGGANGGRANGGRANGGRANGSRANGSGGKGSSGNGPRAETPAPPAADDDWLSLGDDEFSPGSLSPMRDRDESPAGPRILGEGRRFAKEARRRASRRPSPILDLHVERERLDRKDRDREVDFESLLERQPQKGRVARRGSAIRNAFEDGIQSLRRVGGERIADSRDRVQALRERVPSH